MPIIGYPHNFLAGLSDFWQRFFADSPQLASMYDGTAVLLGQTYLDLLANVIGLSLRDAPVFNKQYFQLVLIREDEVSFQEGEFIDQDRWAFSLPGDLVQFGSLDNKVIEPTASLQIGNDYELDAIVPAVLFRQDPTDPVHNGVPLAGYARRALDVSTGGSFDDPSKTNTWANLSVYKGDVLRVLDIGPSGQQRKQVDCTVILVRDNALYVSPATPLPAAAPNYVVLRRPFNYNVSLEPLSFVGSSAQLAHSRLDEGSVRVYAQRLSDGADVVEGTDYEVDYEKGIILRLTTWAPFSANKVDYEWRRPIYPLAGGPPFFSTMGQTTSGPGTTRVLQVALWAPDALVDRRTLANNFGSLIGVVRPSSEAYRAFLAGLFQLYLLGPTLERLESALNVILGLPVVRDDGEVFLSLDTSQPDFNRVTTRRPSTGRPATYDFPKAAPLLPAFSDPASVGTLTLHAFEPLTTAITVADYVQDPTWWHDVVIPPELFSTAGGAQVPPIYRRTVSPLLIRHVANPEDGAKAGDPGLYAGADDYNVMPAAGVPVFRHRTAFVLMDRFLKFHTFIVRFDAAALTDAASSLSVSVDELNKLVLSAKPAHTYVFAQPTTTFVDTVIIDDTTDDVYQPQRYVGANPDAPEIYPNVGALPDPLQPYVMLGLFLSLPIGSPSGNDDKVLFQDGVLQAGANGWHAGDYFHFELDSAPFSFPSVISPVTVGAAPAPPRRRRLVRVFVNALVGGKHVVENVDYTVDYANCTVLRTSAWDSTTGITVTVVQANIINVVDGPDPTVGDTPLLAGGIDPANARAAYDPAAVDWFGNPIPVNNHRDLSLVERPLNLKVT